MMWYRLLDSLREHLLVQLPASLIEVGAAGSVPRQATVRLRRGDETIQWAATRYRAEGIENLIIECWACNNVTLLAYQALANLETAVLDALRTWRLDGVKLFNILVTTETDGDFYHPSVGSKFSLQINWKLEEV